MPDKHEHTTTPHGHNQTPHGIAPHAAIAWTDRLWLAAMCLSNGIPVAVAMLLTVMFKRFGAGNTATLTHLAWALVPWMMRPLCNMLMRRMGWRKETWLVATEMAMLATIASMAALVGTDYWRPCTTLLLIVMSTCGMIHCVVTESLYKEVTANRYPVPLRPMFMAYHAAALLIGLGLTAMVAGNIEVLTRNIYRAWRIAFRLTAMLYAVLTAYNMWKAWSRRHATDGTDDIYNVASWREMAGAMRLFFGNHSPSIGATFLLLFPLPMGLVTGLSPLFLVDSIHRGGLGLSPQEYGLAGGTVGIIGTAVGCLAYTRLHKHIHFDRLVVPVSLATVLTPLSLLIMSSLEAPSLYAINMCMLTGHAAFGMALAVYVNFLAFYSCGRYKHTFFSTGIAIASLSTAIAYYIAGPLQRSLGYHDYFVAATCSCCVAVAAAVLLKMKCFGNSITNKHTTPPTNTGHTTGHTAIRHDADSGTHQPYGATDDNTTDKYKNKQKK